MAPGSYIKGVKHITRDDAFLQKDHEGNVSFMPSFIGETLGQLAAWNVMSEHDFMLRPVAGMCAKASLHHPSYVGDTLILESFIDSLDKEVVQYHSHATVNEKRVFSIEGAFGPLLPMADFISESEIRQQFAEIFRPGEMVIEETPVESVLSDSFQPTYQVAPMMFDKIIKSDPGETLVAEKKITRAAPYFPDHFPKKPVLPLTVLLECKINLAYEFIARAGFDSAYQVRELQKIKMNEFVSPGSVVTTNVRIKRKLEDELILTFRSEVEGKRVCVTDALLSPIR